MAKQCFNVAIFGTFDVENYGDLLFPLIAKLELSKRFDVIEVHPYSYHAKSYPQWPYCVRSVMDFSARIAGYDGILIGGGHIIRFDKDVAQAYEPPSSSFHHPTSYWLVPSIIGLQHDVPLIWNAPGVFGSIPSWAAPLLKLGLQLSSYASVRDKYSNVELSKLDINIPIKVVPDTAFTVSRLIDHTQPSKEFVDLKLKYGLSKRYIIVQATSRGLEFFLKLISNNRESFKSYLFLVIPIGPAVGDSERYVEVDLPEVIKLPFWPNPLLIAELICHAEGVVGSSYHLSITALAFGVPVFSTVDLSEGKLSVLAKYGGIFSLPIEGDIYPPWFLKRLGKVRPSHAVVDAVEQLDVHWDNIANIIQTGKKSTSRVLNDFWFKLPIILEAAATDCIESRTKLNQLDVSNKAMHNSLSFRITKPLREVKRFLKYLTGKLIND